MLMDLPGKRLSGVRQDNEQTEHQHAHHYGQAAKRCAGGGTGSGGAIAFMCLYGFLLRGLICLVFVVIP